MSRTLKIKIGVLLAVVLASMVTMGVLLSNMQNQLSREGYIEEMKAENAELDELLAAAEDEDAQNKEQFDDVYRSKAASVAFMANNDTGFEATDAKMAEYQELLAVSNIMVVKRDGSVVAKAAPTKADFSYARFNRLRSCLDTGAPSAAVEIKVPEEDWLYRYYAAPIDADTMVVVEQDPAEYRELTEATTSTESVLGGISIGQHGFMFAVSAQDYLIDHHPDADLVGADAIDLGLDVTHLEDGNFCTLTLDGEELFCNVRLIGDTYYIAAVPEGDMAAAGAVTVGVILFAFFVVVASVTLYGIFVLRDQERRSAEGSGDEGEQKAPAAGWHLNRTVAGKIATFSIVGFLGVLVVSFYMQTLFALSSQSLTNNERVQQIADQIEDADKQADELTAQYSERFLSKAEVAAHIIDQNPELAERTKLQELADALDIQHVFVFNQDGVMTSTNSSYTNFVLSDDPEDQSYEFRKLLQGVDSVVQDAQPDEISGELRQYIGVTTHNEDGTTNGFVQLGIRPTRLQDVLDSVQIDRVLDGVKVGADGFAFAVNKADKTIAYYPDKLVVGKKADAVGLGENQLKDGFSDYLTINGKTFYTSATETDDYYVFVAGSEGQLMSERGPLTIATGAIALVCLAVIFLAVTLEPKQEPIAAAAAAGDDDEPARVVNVEVGGRTLRTESAASRWLNRSFAWDEMTPERKTGTVLSWFAGIGVIAVCAAVIFKDSIFDKGSIFAYILGGSWQHGLNIFAITASIMFACVALTICAVVQRILRAVSRVLEARGVTMCRLLSSVVKYATMIGMLYWCLALLGVDTATLLASAGLLTFAVSLGAQGIVSDIIAGLFIIFEGEFRVGDIIQVNGQRGTVMEIGVRTTKINDGSGNVLVLRNSSISNVVNMTKETSYAAVEVGIEYGESLERVESILAKELPRIKERHPSIIDGPFYKGVTMLADSSVNIKIVAECAEKDRGGLTNDLNREMKLLFDKYDISMPFPQIVVNEPIDFKKATWADKRAAEAFNKEQREASRRINDNEDEDFDESNDSRR